MSISDVGFEVSGLRKGLGANVAVERSKATVRIGVALQFGRCDKGFTTLFAFVAQPIVQAALSHQAGAAAAAVTAAATLEAISKDLNRR